MGGYMNNTIKDCLKGLSKEELDQHKELIEECMEREKALDNFDVSGFCGVMGNLVKGLETILEKTKENNKSLEECKDKIALSNLDVVGPIQ